MLVITRKRDQALMIDVQGTPIYIHVLKTQRGCASIGVDAPKEWGIRRTEITTSLAGSAEPLTHTGQ